MIAKIQAQYMNLIEDSACMVENLSSNVHIVALYLGEQEA